MEIFYTLLGLVVIVLLLSPRSRMLARMDLLEEEIRRLRQEIQSAATTLLQASQSPPPPAQTPIIQARSYGAS